MRQLAMTVRSVLAATLVAGLILLTGISLGVPAASAACYPPGSASCSGLSTSTGTVPAGGSFTLTGSGYGAGAAITINVCNLETLHTTANGNGSFSIVITIPAGASASTCLITATGTGANGKLLSQTTTINITNAGTTIPGTHTGEPWSSWLYWSGAAAAGLLAFAMFGLARRRTAPSRT
jgi:MYXO-CTERM domain-containing protein